MHPRALYAFSLILALLITLAPAPGWPQNQKQCSVEALRPIPQKNTYIVQLSSPLPNPSIITNPHSAFLLSLAPLGIQVRIQSNFSTLIHAMSIEVISTPSSLSRSVPELLQSLPLVERVWPSIKYPAPKFRSYQTFGSEAHPSSSSGSIAEMKQYASDLLKAHTQYKLNGKDVRIGVLDSGIDYRHPALGGCFGPGCKVAYGYDFVGDDYTGPEGDLSGKGESPQPDADPFDECNGHGTAIAGIIAGSGQSTQTSKSPVGTGVAPEATLGAYRIFSCSGYVDQHIVMQALERAYADGMDIINLSFGVGSGWASSPESLMVSQLVSKGILVVAAVGNDGELGLWEVGTPAVADGVIAVTSFENRTYLALPIQGQEEHQVYDYQTQDGTPFSLSIPRTTPPSSAPSVDQSPGNFPSYPLISAARRLLNARDGCANATEEEKRDRPLEGSVLLVRRGNCDFYTKAMLAQDLGAVAVLFANTFPGEFVPSVDPDPGVTSALRIPFGWMPQITGDRLEAAFPLNISFPPDPRPFPNPEVGSVSTFSSWGLAPELNIKPDIGAPGGSIYAPFPTSLAPGGWLTQTGTSFASPYVVGALALVQQGLGRRVPVHEAKQRLHGATMPCLAESVARQGSGLLDLDRLLSGIQGPLGSSFASSSSSSSSSSSPSGQLRSDPIKIALNDTIKGQPRAKDVSILLQLSPSGFKEEGKGERVFRIGHTSVPTILASDPDHPREKVGQVARVSFPDLKPAGPLAPGHFLLRVPANQREATVRLRFHPPALSLLKRDSELLIYSGYILLEEVNPSSDDSKDKDTLGGFLRRVFDSQGSLTPALSIPYAGVAGDLRGRRIIRPGSESFFLPTDPQAIKTAHPNDPTPFPPSIKEVNITLAQLQKLGVELSFFLDRPSARTEVRLIQLSSSSSSSSSHIQLGRIVGGLDEWLPRNDRDNPITAYLWQGSYHANISLGSGQLSGMANAEDITHAKHVSPGTYQLELMALRFAGDPHNPDDYSSWSSPIIHVT
ncbi:MAG: peptidase S8/S53 domain-containing protein [Piptocephalis tieghemiana]|nr:MAG: peptidase S8/S53 domain-containing protein [Piptocephalis tieghemiana]